VIFLILGLVVCYSLWENHSIIANFNNSTSNETDGQSFNISKDMELPFQFFAVFPLEDEMETNWTLSEPSENELTEAIEAGKEALGDREILEELLVTPALNSPTFRHQKVVRTTREGRIASKRGYVEDYATRHIAKRLNHKREYGKRNDIGRGPSSNLEGSRKDVECEDFLSKYRSNDGICNNRKSPHWGSSNIPFRRALNPDYCDGISQPRCALDGSLLPSAREISMTVHRPSYYTDPNFTVMLAVWGQFLDHDITATAGTSGENGEPIECCNTQNLHPECFIVPLGKGDPYFDDYNMTCMNFIRSAPSPTNRLGPREQLNQATAFIDGSVVYGATDVKVKSLRSFKDGQLEVFVTPDNRTLLPVSKDPRDGCNEVEQNAKGRYCFTSGDERANENLHLTSMHLLWHRHHNYLATELKKVNSHWDDEKLFQESRRILAAQMQHITYNEFLSVIIGKRASENFGLLSTPGGREDTYDDETNPSVANEFAASAFRFAHTLLPGLMKVTKALNDSEESIALHNMLFNPYSLYRPNGFDSAIRSAINNSVEKSDSYFTTELTEKLFAKDASPVICGLDLVSLNVSKFTSL
jgi:peroxidase